jgi:hypothetical protein
MVIMFSVTLFTMNTRIKEQLLYAVIIGFVGEYLFSLVMGMCIYRLDNIPHYILTGHGLVYLGELYLTKYFM